MNLFEKQNKPFAIKLSDRVKEEIKKEFGVDFSNYKLAEYFIFISKDNWAFSLNKPPHTLITEAELFGDGSDKLREKMQMYVDIYKEEHLVDALEQINDDFAVKFAEWKQENDTCEICKGDGYTIEVEAECCWNTGYIEEYGGCCGIPNPIQVQKECKCNKGKTHTTELLQIFKTQVYGK